MTLSTWWEVNNFSPFLQFLCKLHCRPNSSCSAIKPCYTCYCKKFMGNKNNYKYTLFGRLKNYFHWPTAEKRKRNVMFSGFLALFCILFMRKCHRGIKKSVLSEFTAQKMNAPVPDKFIFVIQPMTKNENSNKALHLHTCTSTDPENRKDPQLPGPTVTAYTPTPSQRDPDLSIVKTPLPLSDNEHGNVLHKEGQIGAERTQQRSKAPC